MSEHFNKLTPEEAERLAWLSEELGECVQAVGKILRHGYMVVGARPYNNRHDLEKELGDVLAATYVMFGAKDIDVNNVTQFRNLKLQKVQKYLHHNTIDLSHAETKTSDVATAMSVLRKAMKDDPGYLETWRANLIMSFIDAANSCRCDPVDFDAGVRKSAERAADNFLNLLEGAF